MREIHPGYFKEFDEFDGKKLRPPGSVIRRRKVRRHGLLKQPYSFHAVLGAGLICFWGGWSVSSLRHVDMGTISVESEEQKPEEIALMKQILAGLVRSVDELSKRSGTEAASGFEESGVRVKVKAEKVNLRAEPSLSAASLRVVDGGTELVATEVENGWVKVLSPLGDSAWIKKELVEVLNGARG